MYQLKRTGMKCLKILHLFTVCCWVGGALSLALLNLNNSAAVSEEMLYGLNTASHLIDIWVVVIFGAMGCLLTGLLYTVLTPWGFFKHKWVILKWVLTITCILTGTFFLGVWEKNMLDLSRHLGNSALADLEYLSTKAKHLYLSAVQIFSLLFMLGISVLKPWGKKQS